MRTLRYALGAGVLTVLAAAVSVAARRGSAVRAGAHGHSHATAFLFFTLVAVAFVLYLCALLAVRFGREGVALVPLCAVAAAIQLVPLAGPLLLSRDAYSYWAYGRIVVQHHADPFTLPPARFPHDPATRAVARGWRRQPSVYGTGFTFASAIVASVVHRSAELASFVFRAAAAIAGIVAMLVAVAIARRKTFAAVFIGWNPLLAVNFAGGGHNDAWMVALMLVGVALVARQRDVAGGAAWVLAVAIKAAALPLLALELVRSRRRHLLGVAVAALAVAGISTAAFGTSWLTPLVGLDHRQARFALPARLEQLSVPSGAAHLAAYALLVVGAAWLVREAVRGRTRLALGASLLLVTTPWLLPWYATWPVALASVDDDGFAQVVALVLTAYLLPSRIPL
jgi:hypothetical protein